MVRKGDLERRLLRQVSSDRTIREYAEKNLELENVAGVVDGMSYILTDPS